MKAVLDLLLPRILPEGVRHTVHPHQGIRDLRRSIPRKLRGWRTPGTRFVILQDSHSAPCEQEKAELSQICRQASRPDTLVRIVCPELESWFLGDLRAVGKAFPRGNPQRHERKAKFRDDPDRLTNAVDALKRLAPEYTKISGSRRIAEHMDLNANRSHSFRVFVDGLRRLSRDTRDTE